MLKNAEAFLMQTMCRFRSEQSIHERPTGKDDHIHLSLLPNSPAGIHDDFDDRAMEAPSDSAGGRPACDVCDDGPNQGTRVNHVDTR